MRVEQRPVRLSMCKTRRERVVRLQCLAWRRLPLPLVLVAAACISATAMQAQQSISQDAPRATTRSIEGRVLNATGAAVPGAVVLLKDGKTLQVRSYIAQKNGIYHFFGLSTDVNYTVRAENKGITSKDKNVSVFDSHKVVKLDLKLTKKPKGERL